ncbi:Adenylate cyclase type 10 [Phlyctochytrium planicorne]|nr:Adenylate cyclase type 10 [Phlyctochytrium planicorne]
MVVATATKRIRSHLPGSEVATQFLLSTALFGYTLLISSLLTATLLVSYLPAAASHLVAPIVEFVKARRRPRIHIISARAAERLKMLSQSKENCRPIPKDRLSTQPAELTLKMLSFMSAKDLALVSQLSTYFHKLANDDTLWKMQCNERWEDKKHQKLQLHPRIDYCYIMDRLTDLEMRQVLERRYVKNVPHDASREELEKRLKMTTYHGAAFVPFYSGKWKSTYIAAEVDQHRQIITRDEVMEYEWIFSDFWSYGYDEDEHQIRIKFWPDGTRSNVDRSKKYSRPRPQPWHINEKGAIQVSSFPEHNAPSRTMDWGYTALTDKLAALGGIDRIKDVLNPPFETIINTVHKRSGSVVKLAGDSAIVLWNLPPAFEERLLSLGFAPEEAERKAREHVCGLAVLCCVEILGLFEDFEIVVEGREGNVGRKETGSRKRHSAGHVSVKMEGSSAVESAAVAANSQKDGNEEEGNVQKLGIHVGLGFGEVQHVFVGRGSGGGGGDVAIEKGKNGGVDEVKGRSEYFIAGRALLDAGAMLSKGKSGQLVFGEEHLSSFSYISLLREFRNAHHGKEIFVQLVDKRVAELMDALQKTVSVASSYHPGDWNEGILPTTFNISQSLLNFIEPSLLIHLKSPIAPSADHNPSANTFFSDNMNQFRTITVLFLHFPNLPIERLGNSQRVWKDVRFVTKEAIRIVEKHGGTCRQIHADEKALSVLLVWGGEGFSHEKGDHIYAVAAGLEIESLMAKRRWWCDDDLTHEERLLAVNFSLAVTMGKAFCGFIGTESRSEGTVLGPCVNLAARIMCNSHCNNRLLCDETIAEVCESTVEFEDVGCMFAKGIENSIRIFSPKRIINIANHENALQEKSVLEGRDKEITVLSEVFGRWIEGNKSAALVVGKSGFGKTHLVKSFLRGLRMDHGILVCSARENRNDSNYIYLQVVQNFYNQLAKRGWSAERIRFLMQRKRLSAAALLKPADSTENTGTNSAMSSSSIASGGNFDTAAKMDFLSALGIPRKSIKALQASYPMLFSESGTDVPSTEAQSSDAASVLITVVTNILQILPMTLKQKVVLFLDDVQEYDAKLRGYFDRFEAFSFCELVPIEKIPEFAIEKLVIAEMRLYGFELDKIAPKLLQDIVAKSQGNPMVIQLLCKYLSESPDVIVAEKTLKHVLGKNNDSNHASLPMNVSAAVISTLDKMPSNAQMLLRVASVAAQFFNLSELAFCLEKQNLSFSSQSEMVEVLQLAQAQGILSPFQSGESNAKTDFSFHHYLIFKGIYDSILQSRKTELHYLYAEYYQNLYETTMTTGFLPTLLYHLLKLPGEDRRKMKFVRVAFSQFAAWHRPIESQVYYDLLQEFKARYPEERTPIQIAEEQRLLAINQMDLGDSKKCAKHVYGTFEALSCNLRVSKFKLIIRIMKGAKEVGKALNMGKAGRNQLALQCLSRNFPLAFSKGDMAIYKADSEGKVCSEESKAVHLRVRVAVDENQIVLPLRFGILCGDGTWSWTWIDSDIIFETDEPNAVATANISMATVLIAFGKLKEARQIGNLNYLLRDVVANIKGIYKDEDRLAGDIHVTLAYAQISLGQYQEAWKNYKTAGTILENDKDARAIRAVMFAIFKCHLEVIFLSNTKGQATFEDESFLRKSLMLTSWIICNAKKKLNIPQPVLFPSFLIFVLAWFDYIVLAKSLPNDGSSRLLETSFSTMAKALCFASERGVKVFPGHYAFIKRIKSNLLSLQKKVSKENILLAVETSKCIVEEERIKDAAFLTAHWRSRVLVRIIRLSFLLSKDEQGDVTKYLGKAIERGHERLMEAGIAHEAHILHSA